MTAVRDSDHLPPQKAKWVLFGILKAQSLDGCSFAKWFMGGFADRERSTEPGNGVCWGELRKGFGAMRRGNFQWFDPCFFLKKLDFMRLSLQWSYLTHQLPLKWNNFQGSELCLITQVRSTSSISGFCPSCCLLNHQGLWSCGKILKTKEDSKCHHIFFHAGGVIPDPTADAHKGRLCIANAPANACTGANETSGQALGEKTHLLQTPLWVTPLSSWLNWFEVLELVTTIDFTDCALEKDCFLAWVLQL